MHLLNRRQIMKLIATTPIAATIGIAPKASAAAAEVAAILSVTSTIVSMLTKSNAIAREFSQINVKIDAMIDLQRLTLRSLDHISGQIDQLAAGLVQEFENHTMRETLGESRGLLEGLEGVTSRLLSAKDIEKNYFDEINENYLESECDRALSICSDLLGHVNISNVDGDRGLALMRYAILTIAAAQNFVPTFFLLDSELLANGIKPKSRIARYEVILESLKKTCETLADKHGPNQKSYQQSKADSVFYKMYKKPFGGLKVTSATHPNIRKSDDPVINSWWNRINILVKNNLEVREAIKNSTSSNYDLKFSLNDQVRVNCSGRDGFRETNPKYQFHAASFHIVINLELALIGASPENSIDGEVVPIKINSIKNLHDTPSVSTQPDRTVFNRLEIPKYAPTGDSIALFPESTAYHGPSGWSFCNIIMFRDRFFGEAILPRLNDLYKRFKSDFPNWSVRKLNTIFIDESVSWCNQASRNFDDLLKELK